MLPYPIGQPLHGCLKGLGQGLDQVSNTQHPSDGQSLFVPLPLVVVPGVLMSFFGRVEYTATQLTETLQVEPGGQMLKLNMRPHFNWYDLAYGAGRSIHFSLLFSSALPWPVNRSSQGWLV